MAGALAQYFEQVEILERDRLTIRRFPSRHSPGPAPTWSAGWRPPSTRGDFPGLREGSCQSRCGPRETRPRHLL
jgi:hypothetical protein